MTPDGSQTRIAERVAEGGTQEPLESATQRPIARIEKLEGIVKFARGQQGTWVEAVVGIQLLTGDRLETRTGMARLALGDSTVYVNANSRVRLLTTKTRDGEASLVRLTRGEVYVADQGKRSVHVETPDGLISPVGTRFDVRRSAVLTAVVVQEGVVEARVTRRPNRKVRIQAGHRLLVRAGQSLGKPQRIGASRLFAWTRRLRDEAGLHGRISFREDFSTGSLKGYGVVEQVEHKDRADWAVLDGVLRQRSDIQDGEDARLDQLGTYLLIQPQRFADFIAVHRFQCFDNDSIGFMFRIQDEKNYYRFSVNKQSGYRRLVRCRQGRFTVLQEDKKTEGIQLDRWYRLKVICRGPLISIFIDDKQIFRTRDTAIGAGHVAFYTSGCEGAGFDDLEIYKLRRK